MAHQRLGIINSGVAVLQPGARWKIDETGIARRYESYRCNAAELFTLMPAIRSVHPQYTFLTVKSQTPVDLPGGLVEYSLEYSGIDASGSVSSEGGTGFPDPVYSLHRSQTTEPITTHPNWSDIVAAAGSANVKFDSSGIFLGIGKDSDDSSLVGVTDYLSYGVTFVKQSVVGARPSLSGVGFVGAPPSEAPAVSDGFNWLKGPVDYSQEGFVYAVSETWILSGRGGWNPHIYGS